MQDCFREHPEMYGSELEDDEDEVEGEIRAQQSAKEGDAIAPAGHEEAPESVLNAATDAPQHSETKKPIDEPHRDSSATTLEGAQNAGDECGELLPKAAHDAASK